MPCCRTVVEFSARSIQETESVWVNVYWCIHGTLAIPVALLVFHNPAIETLDDVVAASRNGAADTACSFASAAAPKTKAHAILAVWLILT